MVASGEGNEQPLGVARAAGEVSWAAAARMTAEAGGEKNRPLRTISAASTVISSSSNPAGSSPAGRGDGPRCRMLVINSTGPTIKSDQYLFNLLHVGCATPPRASTKRHQPAPMQDQRYPWRNLRYILPSTLLHRCKTRAIFPAVIHDQARRGTSLARDCGPAEIEPSPPAGANDRVRTSSCLLFDAPNRRVLKQGPQ